MLHIRCAWVIITIGGLVVGILAWCAYRAHDSFIQRTSFATIRDGVYQRDERVRFVGDYIHVDRGPDVDVTDYERQIASNDILSHMFFSVTEVKGPLNDREMQLLQSFDKLSSLEFNHPGTKMFPVTVDGLRQLRHLRNIKRLSVSFTAFDDECLSFLESLNLLESLDLSYSFVTNLSAMPALPNLRHLFLSGCVIEVDTLDHLQKLPQLKTLSLGFYDPDGPVRARTSHIEAIQYLEPLKNLDPLTVSIGWINRDTSCLRHLLQMKHLKHLRMEYSYVNDDAVMYLRELKALEELDIRDAQLSSNGLVNLCDLTNLRILSLNSAINHDGLSGNALRDLRKLPCLEEFNVDDCRVTDDAFINCPILPSLQRLSVSGNRLTDVGAKMICERFPKLKYIDVSRNDLTVESFRKLAAIKSLQTLKIDSTDHAQEVVRPGLQVQFY